MLMQQVIDRYNEGIKQSGVKNCPNWVDLPDTHKVLFERWCDNSEKVPDDLQACAKQLFILYYVGEVFSNPAWICLEVDGTMSVTCCSLIGFNKKDCGCPAFNLNGNCKHTQIFEGMLNVLKTQSSVPGSNASWGISAYYSTDDKKLKYFDFCPFIQNGKVLALPSKVQTELHKGCVGGWLSYFVELSQCINIGVRYDPKDVIRLMRVTNINLVTGGSFESLRKLVSDQVVEELITKGDLKLQPPPVIEQDEEVPVITTVVKSSGLRGCLKYKKPNDNVFYVADDVWRQCLFTVSQSKNLMLLGPAGSGKTELGIILAKQMGKNVEVLNCGAMTEPRLSLIGNTHFSPDKGTFFSDSRFVKAITTKNTLVLLDELSRAPKDAFNILLPVLDKRRELVLDEDDGKVVKVAEGVCFLATANVGIEYTGTSTIDRALKDRFGQVEVGFPPVDNEIKLLKARTGIPVKFATYLVNIANNQRVQATKEMEFTELISTRMLLLAAEQYVFGIPFHEAIKFAISGMFSDEGAEQGDRFKIQTIVTRVVPKVDLNSSTV